MANVIKLLITYFCIPKNFGFVSPSFSSAEGRHMPDDKPALDSHIAFLSISILYVYVYVYAFA